MGVNHIADEYADIRRRLDALRAGKDVPPAPPVGGLPLISNAICPHCHGVGWLRVFVGTVAVNRTDMVICKLCGNPKENPKP